MLFFPTLQELTVQSNKYIYNDQRCTFVGTVMAVGVEEMDVRENMHPKNFIFKSDIDLTFVFLLIMWFYFILKYTNGTFKCNEH